MLRHCHPSPFAIIFLLVSSSLFIAQRETATAQQIRTLELNKPIEGELRGGEKQSFQIALNPLQYARVTVMARGFDISLKLMTPDGKTIAEYVWPRNAPDPAEMSLVAGYSGDYRLEIASTEKSDQANPFSVTLAELRLTGKLDPERIEAERQFAKGEQLRSGQTAEDRRAALTNYAEALKLWRAANDRKKEAWALSALGQVSFALKENQQALDYHNQVLIINRELKDRKGEAETLNDIGQIHQGMGQQKQALEFFRLALPLMQETGNQRGEATALTLIATSQLISGEFNTSLESFAQARTLWQKIGDKSEEAGAHVGIGRIHEAMNDRPKALEAYAEALKIYRADKNQAGEASSLFDLGVLNRDTGDNKKALEYLQQALSLWQSLNRRSEEASTLNFLGLVYKTLGEKQLALENYEQSLAIAREMGNRRLEATVLNNIAAVHSASGEKRKALDSYNSVLPLRRAAKDKLGEASTLTNIGGVHADLGENQLALEFYNQALPLWRESKRVDGEIITIQNIGETYDRLGEKQKSLDNYAQALTLARTIGAKQIEGTIQTNLATVYASLGEKEKALEMYLRALEIHRATGNRTAEGDTLHLLGFLNYEMEDLAKALDYMNQEAIIWRQLKDLRAEGVMLGAMGMVYRKLGDRQKSLESLNQALVLHREVGNRQGEVDSLIEIGLNESDSGRMQKALENFNRAVEISQNLRDPNQEAKARYEIARANLALDELDQSRSQIEETLSIVESLRTKVASQELRASYFATVQKYYDFYIELLMRMHRQNTNKGFDGEALQASERARARSLLEILTEANASIREGVDPLLLERESTLQHQLSGKADALSRLYASKPSPEQVAALRKEIDDLTTEYDDVRAEIRRASPRYAALTQPSPLSLKEIQQQVLDSDTLLLEYSLGENRSFLWAVTPTKINSYALPPRAEIEEAARKAYQWLSKPDQIKAPASNRRLKHNESELSESQRRDQAIKAINYLSNTLLKPVASQLGNKRLVIVASGALQYVPFAALPKPANNVRRKGSAAQTASGQPLIVDHEVINLPSASTLSVLRRETTSRQPAPKMLAVLADPVFEKDDERVRTTARPTISSGQLSTDKELAKSESAAVAEERSLKHIKEKSAEQTGEMRIARLPYTRQEAENILSLVSESDRKQALDFEASRSTATGKDLSQYRYVHFATHGYLDSERPEFSALVLSLVDKDGRQQSGFLYAYEIYNLNLPAEVVVLSACETGLGKEIRGEGLVGLTRGFMYAGSPRVVVSLWSVNDRATAELMARFYQKMMKENLRPAAALRAAQIEMWKSNQWNQPYYWAAFALQGEWR